MNLQVGHWDFDIEVEDLGAEGVLNSDLSKLGFRIWGFRNLEIAKLAFAGTNLTPLVS